MGDFWKGLLSTAIPIIVLSIVLSIIGALVDVNNENNMGIGVLGLLLWWAIGVAFLVAIIRAVVSGIRRNLKLSAGILVGMVIGIVAAGTSCFAWLNSVQF